MCFNTTTKISLSFPPNVLEQKIAKGCPGDKFCGLTTDLSPTCVSQRCGDNNYACGSETGTSLCCKVGEECLAGAGGKPRCAVPQRRCSNEERICYGSAGENCCPKGDDCTPDGMCLTASVPACAGQKTLCPDNANLGMNYDSPSEPFLCCNAQEHCETLTSAGSYVCARGPRHDYRGIAHAPGNPAAPKQGEFH